VELVNIALTHGQIGKLAGEKRNLRAANSEAAEEPQAQLRELGVRFVKS
jgi:hypothetical protein